MARGHSLRYAPLADYLRQHADGEVTLTFVEIEAILGAPLPASALSRQFWSNGFTGTFRRGAWQEAGWRVTRFDRWAAVPTVTFARTSDR